MPLSEQQFIELEGNIRKTWDAYIKEEEDFFPKLYNIITNKNSMFTDFTVGAMGRMTPWEGSVAYDSFEKGYEKTYRPAKYSTGIQIPRDMYEDKEYEQIKTRVNNIAHGVIKTLQYESADVFENAFSSSYTGPDGKALCASDHKTIPTAPEQSNVGTSDLSYDSYESTLLAMKDWADDRGDKMLIRGDLVIAGEYWRKTCKQLFGSDKEAYVSDNQINAYKDVEYYIHPLITGKKWFVANKRAMKGGAGLNLVMRRDPRKIERDGATALGDFNTEMLSWKAVGRWVKGWTNWFFLYGHNPS